MSRYALLSALAEAPIKQSLAVTGSVDQHGGGEGRTAGGRHPVSPWGVPAKGYRTRKNKRTDNMIVRRRYRK